MNRKRISIAITAGVLLAAGIGGGFAFASGGTDQPGIGLNKAGQEFFCIGSDKVMHVNPTFDNSKCPAGTKGLNYPVSGSAVAAAVAPLLPKPAYGIAMVNVSRNGAAATTWETLSTSLGSPVGDTASGTFRFTCSGSAPCEISVKAYTTADGYTVYPRLDIMSQVEGTGENYCEYADGADNDGASATVGTTATAVKLGIGSTADCGAGQAGGVVDSILVPNGAQDHYDVSATFVFAKK